MMLLRRLDGVSEKRKKDVNIFLLGLAFFFVFTAFFTMGNIQTVIIDNAMDENSTGYVEDFDGDGYISLSIVYAVSCFCDFIAPSVMAVLGLKASMVAASTTYSIFIATFYVLMEELLYAGSAVMGMGNALIWVSQGAFLSLNSDPDTIARNSGLFYAFFQLSGLIGNTFSYFQFKDSYEIDKETRDLFVSVLLVISCVGTATLCLLLPTPWEEAVTRGKKPDTPVTAFKRAIALFMTPQMLHLVFFFVYTGLSFAFWTGVYGPSLSFSLSFGTGNNSLTGLHGIMIHTAAITSGLFFARFGHLLTRKVGRYPVVVFAITCHFVSYVTIFLNVPSDAPLGETHDDAILVVPSSTGLALFSSFMLGIGTGCIDTQILALLGSVYADRSRQAFAVLKVSQHGIICVGFAYAGHLTLYWQLGILFVTGVLGGTAFTKIDIQTARKKKREVKEDRDVVEETVS